MDKTWNLNQAAKNRNANSMQALMEHIKRDIIIAGNRPDALSELEVFTHVNLMTSKKYQDQVNQVVDGIDSNLRRKMKSG